MPHMTLMWRVGCVTMMSRADHSCRSKDARLLILTALVELLFYCRSKMAGYAAKAFSRRCLLHISDNVVADFCVRRGRGEIIGSSLVCPVFGPLFGGGLVGGTSWGGTLPVLTCSQRIASSSPVVAAGTCGGCGAVGAVPVLDAAIPCRTSMSF